MREDCASMARCGRRRGPVGAARVGLTLVLGLVVSGCALIPPPPGPAPLRYRDEIFSTVGSTVDLTYGSAPGLDGNPQALKLDLYEPPGDTAIARPAVVLIHSGAFSFGNKDSEELVDLAGALARRGIVSASINYRLLAPAGCTGTNGTTPVCTAAARGAQHDAQAAVRWLRANAARYRIDPDRIAMAGSSAGGITALLVAYRSDDPGASGNPGPSSAIGAAISLSGGVPGAATYTGSGDAPALLFHGTADAVIPFGWSVETALASLGAGIYVNLQLFADAGHVPYPEFRDRIVAQTVNFLYQQLRLDSAAT